MVSCQKMSILPHCLKIRHLCSTNFLLKTLEGCETSPGTQVKRVHGAFIKQKLV